MNATELIVELVLTGLLALAALLLPALVAAGTNLDLTAETAALWVAGGFLLGVVVDRCADSIMARWEGFLRCKYAFHEELASVRGRLLGDQPATDPFPEHWMRVKMMAAGGEGVISWLQQTRVRIRIARTVGMLTPMLTTSAMLAAAVYAHGNLVPESPDSRSLPRFGISAVPQLTALMFWFAVAEIPKQFTPPKTYKHSAAPSWNDLIWSPTTGWLGSQVAIAGAVVWFASPEARTTVWLVLVLGTLLSTLGILAWWRLSRTFMSFLWMFCRSEFPDELTREMTTAASAQPVPLPNALHPAGGEGIPIPAESSDRDR